MASSGKSIGRSVNQFDFWLEIHGSKDIPKKTPRGKRSRDSRRGWGYDNDDYAPISSQFLETS